MFSGSQPEVIESLELLKQVLTILHTTPLPIKKPTWTGFWFLCFQLNYVRPVLLVVLSAGRSGKNGEKFTYRFCIYEFFLIFVFFGRHTHIEGWVRQECERETETKSDREIFNPLMYSSNACKSQEWPRLKPGVGNLFWVLYIGDKLPAL